MNEVITVIATVKCASGKGPEFFEEITKVMPLVRKEEGCISYKLHQDLVNKDTLVFIEEWENAALLQKHSKGENLAKFAPVLKSCGAELDVKNLSLVF